MGKPGLWTRFEFSVLLPIAAVLLLLATGVMLVEAFSRGFLSHSYFWAEEAVRYLIIWGFFLTIGTAGRAGHHIRAELIVEMLPRGIQRLSHLLASICGLLFSVVLLSASIPQVQRYYTMGMRTESTLDLPMWVLFLAMPIGAVLLAGYYVGCLLRAWRGDDPFQQQPGAAPGGAPS